MLLSVIVPVYNAENYLKRCIESVLNQAFADFELILVDDGSTDSSGAICDKYAMRDSRVKVIHKKNGGVVSSRNAALNEAQGDYICHIDADDWVLDNYFEKISSRLMALEQKPDILIFGYQEVYEDKVEPKYVNVEMGFFDRTGIEKKILPYFISDSRFLFWKSGINGSLWNKVYKRKLLQKHRCQDERLKLGEDAVCNFECIFHANSIYVCRDTLYCYNKANVLSATTVYKPELIRNSYNVAVYMKKHIGGKNKVIDRQINEMASASLIIAIFHDLRHGIPYRQARKHIAQEIRDTGYFKLIRLSGLPLSEKSYLFLVKLRLYLPVILISKCMIGMERYVAFLKAKNSTPMRKA